MTDPDQLLQFNGLDATTGAALFTPRDASTFATRLLMQASSGIDAEHLAELQGRDSLSIKEGVDITDLAQTGWGVVFPAVRPGTPEARRQDAIAEALYPLFDLRRGQAARLDERRFKIYRGAEGYWPQETKNDYLARIGATPGFIDPDRVPYYLMLVASPAELPFAVQVQLDVHYSVGRLHFDTIEPYAHYARTVLAAEAGPLRPRSVALVGVANPGDPVSTASARDIVATLATPLATVAAPDWQVFHYAGEYAQKASVARLLGGDATPAVLLTSGHGLGYPNGDPQQRRHQGALVCQDWPGPVPQGRLDVGAHCFSVDDVRPDADLAGMIWIDLACFGAGTPVLTDDGRPLADGAFLSPLHQAVLGHPRGGALATIGHLERAYGAAAHSDQARGHRMALDIALRKLLAGYPVGAAMEEMNDRYATLALDLHARLTALRSGQSIEPAELADLWITTHDARGCAISGDPAVRVAAPPIRRVDVPTTPRLRTIIPNVAAPAPAAATTTTPTLVPLEQPDEPEEKLDIDVDDDGPPPAMSEPPPLTTATRTLVDVPREQALAESAAPPRSTRPFASQTGKTVVSESARQVLKTVVPEPARQVTHSVTSKPAADTGLAALLNLLSPDRRSAAGLPALPTLEQLTGGVLQLLQRALTDIGDVEVRTFATPDLAAAAGADKLEGSAELRAFTRIHLDGDLDVCVPGGPTAEADRELWQLHGEMVKQAQLHRAELLRVLLTTSAHILRGGV